jgi:hypothetical protein
MEAALALVADAFATHSTCSRGLVEHRRERQRFEALVEVLREKHHEVTTVSNGVAQVPEVREALERVERATQATSAVLDDDTRLAQVYAYTDAVNALEQDVEDLQAVLAKGARYMWDLKYARDTELAQLTTAAEELAGLEEDHQASQVSQSVSQ